ncbi:hypothetical protein [Butyrivibrio sp. WCD3002]|uniref:hypothetical protein n=1 Tax=Butyrivibrio sp. WCD3002 TaxID=1280676 RepID=UPI00040DD07D|nr:hypothetical protein [Butyrivibrio sp. WCD3002]
MQQQLVDGTNVLKIDFFDSIGIQLIPEVESFRSGLMPKNQILETFKRIDKLPFSNLDIRFSDDTWDFSATTDLPVSKTKLVFYFDSSSAYCEPLKMYVLDGILKKNVKIRVLQNKVISVMRFLKQFEAEGYKVYSRVPKTAFKRLFDDMEDTCSYNTVCAYKGHLLRFSDFYERNFEELADKSIRKFLQDRNTAKLNDIKHANKTPEVPIDYFPVFLDAVKAIMRDEKEGPEDRITAATIVLYSQIGFRTAELFTVKTASIHNVYSPNKDKPLYYMDFISFKHGKGESGGTIAHTYINSLSREAYNLLEELCREYRNNLGVDTLLVTKFQKNATTTAQQYSTRYRKFVMRHWKELQCLNIGDDYEDLSFFEVGTFFQPDKDGYYTYDKNADWAKDLQMDDRIYYPTIRQFRVSVCTSLYRQQVPLHYIRKHMNHLSEDMAAYYIRPQKNLEKEYSETIYRAVFKDGSKMLGTNGDAFIQKINEFIEQNHMNIQDDMEGVIRVVAKKFPLRSKVGGMCIRCGEVIPCASNNSTDVIYCAFGMCPNHCHMFFMADISYEEYLQNRDTAQYNKDNGYKKAYQKEVNKLKYIIEHSLMPELTMLKDELERHGEEDILEKYPQLTYIVNHLDSIKQEVQTWM